MRTIGLLAALAALAPGAAGAQAGSPMPSSTGPQAAPAPPELWAIHGQATLTGQGNFRFRAPYEGANSLDGAGDLRETVDATLYVGITPWHGFEVWLNPEIDQGFGLRNTLGAAGFPSAEAYKVGKKIPYFRLQRVFVRQTIDLGGQREAVAPDLNQLGGQRAANRLTLTIGKLSVADIFDANKYAHDPRGDFLNWTAVDLGTFDYAADAWGYTYGGAAELTLGKWTVRGGLFDLSTVPNSATLETNFRQYQVVGEVERRIVVGGRPGAIRLTGWTMHGRFARLDDAVAFGAAHGSAPDPEPVRAFRNRSGIGVDAEQAVSDTVGVFFRVGVGDGRTEAVEFTDIDRSVSGGVSLGGAGWGRKDDRVGVALVANAISAARRRYFAAGGLGILVGDGALPHRGPELIAETFYQFAAVGPLRLTADGQLIANPAYNRDRGPVPVVGVAGARAVLKGASDGVAAKPRRRTGRRGRSPDPPAGLARVGAELTDASASAALCARRASGCVAAKPAPSDGSAGKIARPAGRPCASRRRRDEREGRSSLRRAPR